MTCMTRGVFILSRRASGAPSRSWTIGWPGANWGPAAQPCRQTTPWSNNQTSTFLTRTVETYPLEYGAGAEQQLGPSKDRRLQADCIRLHTVMTSSQRTA